eukprot:CAMPEP_0115556530 /NCGR_PEP_ID=MMETSP0271-20121206/98417_1 /TAXON_ID=71861 /ORGANISM="Scrippsiella trochoidea, Strain CCMP3099" /LENGTH=58 /DNA_ID=CAMNT_0002990411 /DNA_START=59 /DNA_END=235 /DNA_ORIENTATION=+
MSSTVPRMLATSPPSMLPSAADGGDLDPVLLDLDPDPDLDDADLDLDPDLDLDEPATS